MSMIVNRRRFLESTSLLALAALPGAAEPEWQKFSVTTTIQVLQTSGTTRVWVPLPLEQETPFQQRIANAVDCKTGEARVVKTTDGAQLVAAEFPPGKEAKLTVTSEVKTRTWAVNVASASRDRAARSHLEAYLRPTKMLPTDGIVKERAEQITRSANTDLAKARAIYEWVVENTYRNPKVRGCGRGDIRFMLESGDLGGKCADLNALYVGLARAAGLPARDVYGIRVGPSQMGYKSLGAASADVTKAQHCRAEVFLDGWGWVPVDPADVRKVMLEEPPGSRPLEDHVVDSARKRLFGSWEMNWMAYNYAQDVVLPNSSGGPLHFLMYPQAETAEGRVDCLDPNGFRYQITSVALD